MDLVDDPKPIELLLVEDSATDVLTVKAAFAYAKVSNNLMERARDPGRSAACPAAKPATRGAYTTGRGGSRRDA